LLDPELSRLHCFTPAELTPRVTSAGCAVFGSLALVSFCALVLCAPDTCCLRPLNFISFHFFCSLFTLALAYISTTQSRAFSLLRCSTTTAQPHSHHSLTRSMRQAMTARVYRKLEFSLTHITRPLLHNNRAPLLTCLLMRSLRQAMKAHVDRKLGFSETAPGSGGSGQDDDDDDVKVPADAVQLPSWLDGVRLRRVRLRRRPGVSLGLLIETVCRAQRWSPFNTMCSVTGGRWWW
jgi:hypothetical protein